MIVSLSHPLPLLFAAQAVPGGLALPLGLGLLALAAGLALGWFGHRFLLARSAAVPEPAAKALERLPFPATLAGADGRWTAANALADKFFATRNLSSDEAATADLVERIRQCSRNHTADDSCDCQVGEFWINWRLATLPSGTVLGLPCDITLQKSQEALVARERDTALHAARMTSDFVSTLSHDIRVPMNGVLGMANLLLESGLTPQQQELARSVVESAESVITLTDELLDLAKIEAGKFEIHPQATDLGSLLDELLRGHTARAAEKGLDLYCDLDPMLPAEITTDPMRLRQILGNLLSNGLKFTDRGEVFLYAGFEASPDNPNVGELRFFVRDTGIGIPQEKHDHLFKAFSQADSSISSLYGGTGLGLATSRRIADLMGGRLWFESVPGHGSTFHLALPYQPVDGSKPPTWTQKNIKVDGRDILIVEDNPNLGNLLRDWITRWGGRPRLIDAPDIIPWLEAGGRCAVALIDFDLPHANGLAALRTLTQQKSPPRCVLVSARPPEAKHNLDHCDILLKPLFPETLLECLCRPPRTAAPKPAAPTPSVATTPAIAAASPAPAAPANPTPAPVAAARPATPPRARVIVADDDLVNQKVMRTYLERLGCEVRLASNGVEALTLVAAYPCDVLFLDIMMPRMDGMQTVREIRRHENDEHAAGRPTRRLPIVAITAKVMPGDREAGLAAGFDDYATKPINDTRLRESLQKFVPSFQPPGPLAAGAPMLAAAAQNPLIERSRIDELSSGDADTAREIAALLFERMDLLLPELERTLAAGDLTEARRHAHTGAGSCATCGMMQAQNVMRRLERSIEAGQLEHTRDLIAEARRVLVATRAALNDLLPS